MARYSANDFRFVFWIHCEPELGADSCSLLCQNEQRPSPSEAAHTTWSVSAQEIVSEIEIHERKVVKSSVEKYLCWAVLFLRSKDWCPFEDLRCLDDDIPACRSSSKWCVEKAFSYNTNHIKVPQQPISIRSSLFRNQSSESVSSSLSSLSYRTMMLKTVGIDEFFLLTMFLASHSLMLK